MFATAAEDGSVRVWNVDDYTVLSKGECQTQLTGVPTCLAFSGEVMFTGWADGKGATATLASRPPPLAPRGAPREPPRGAPSL